MVEDALRAASNNQLGKSVLTGAVVPINANTPARAVYDAMGMTLTNDGKGNYYLVQSISTPSADLVQFIQQNTGNTYSWGNGVTQASAGTNSAWTSNGPVPITNGDSNLRRDSVVVNGEVFSVPVANCPASVCTNGDPIAWASTDPADQAALAAYASALQKQSAKEAVAAGLVIGTTVALPATLTGVVVGGAIIGGGTSAANQAIDGKPIDPAKVGVDAATSAAAAGLTYGTIKLPAVTADAFAGANSATVSEAVAAARVRQAAMLQDNVGFNISPTAWDAYPTIGRNGTFVSDRQGVMSYFGDTAGKSEITITSSTATQIEKDMGLVPGTLQDGFKIRQVTGVRNMQPVSPLEGNQYFLGSGNHLPGGAPEMVINSIPTVDNSDVNTILKVRVSP